MKDTTLDKLDKDILKAIANDAKMPVKKIAEVVYASVPTVNSRIIELTNKGIIKGYYTEIDNTVFEDSIKCYIDIEISPSHREKLYEYLKESPNVISCDRVTGEYSLMVQAIFKNTYEMDKFINSIQLYGRTKTQIVFSSIIPYRNVIL